MPQPTAANATPLDYWIGDFQFISIDGFPEVAKQQPIIEARPGTEGHGLWLTGRRGQPVTVVTWRDCLDLDDGANTYANYTASIGATVPVMYAGKPFAGAFDILGVRIANEGFKATTGSVGGILPASSVLVICEWDLISLLPPPA